MNNKTTSTNRNLYFSLLLPLFISACGGDGGGGGSSAPNISSTSPADNTSEVARNSNITATFNEDILNTSVDTTSFTLAKSGVDNTAGSVSFDGENNVASFTPDSPFANLANYTATLNTAIIDLSGNALASNYNWSFTTADGAWGSAVPIETDNASSASRPQIAVNKTGQAVAVWVHDVDGAGGISLRASRYTPGSGWGNAEQIAADGISTTRGPQIAIDSKGNATAIWVQNEGSIRNIWSNHFTPDTGWEGTERIEIAAGVGNAFTPTIVANDDGVMIAAWYRNESNPSGQPFYIWTNRLTPETGWGVAEQISNDGLFPSIVIANNGTAMITWTASVASNTDPLFHYSKQFTPANGWDSTATLIDSGQDVSFSRELELDKDNNPVALLNSRTALWLKRYSEVNGWGAAEPIIISDTATQVLTAKFSIDSQDNILAVWQERNGSSLQNLWANSFIPGTGWGTAELIEIKDERDVEAQQLVVDGSGNGIVLWQQSDGTRKNIWGNRFSKGTGWGTAKLIEIENGGGAERVQIGIDSNGNAQAVWQQFDGARTSIRTNRFE